MTQMLGQDTQVTAMLSAAQSGRLHHAWLLVGAQGVGKAGFAHAIAKRLLAEAAGPDPGGELLHVSDTHPIAHLIAAGSHPDFFVIERPISERTGERARSIGVDQIRQLGSRFATTPSLSRRRIVIIDAADDMERAAANALLKNLEEPPQGTIFLLISHAAGRLLPTIRSRCTLLKFAPLSDEAMTSVLRAQLPEASIEEIQSLKAIGGGSPGKALRFAGLDLSAIDEALATLAREGDPHNAIRVALAQKLALKSAQSRYEAFLARTPAFIAQAARHSEGAALANAISQWEAAKSLAQSAVQLSLDPHSTVFALASHVAALAPAQGAAKA